MRQALFQALGRKLRAKLTKSLLSWSCVFGGREMDNNKNTSKNTYSVTESIKCYGEK